MTARIHRTSLQAECGAENCRYLEAIMDVDALTGLLTRRPFCREVERVLSEDPQGAAAGCYAIVYFNVLRFKAINDLFGTDKGDRLLTFIAENLAQEMGERDLACRMESDHFAVLLKDRGDGPEPLIERLLEAVAGYDLPFETTLNAGIYTTTGEQISVDAMIDRAVLAQSAIKGGYAVKYRRFTEAMRREMLGEHEIMGMISAALSGRQFIVHYQPQYNHATGRMIGAEALVRWNHPERGLVSPGVFLPVFEKNGFITTLDLYVFEHVCVLQRRCLDAGLPAVPISTNFSRYDIFEADFVDRIEKIRNRYGIPARLLAVEITESMFIGGAVHVGEVISRLHEIGYGVQMDDFGSGYSSLNVLKDTQVDRIKLDMDFLSGGMENKRGGTILSSVVRMAKWLGVEVIAEGVEQKEQADFLRSIGCDCVQGFLYARPMPDEAFASLLSGSKTGEKLPKAPLMDTMNAADFWNPKSLETLIFSNFVGGAAIFELRDGKTEILRVNPKYLSELSMNFSEREITRMDLLGTMDEENRRIYLDMLERAMQSGGEEECETWRTVSSACCGDECFAIRANVRMIGRAGDAVLFYAMIRNITGERRAYESVIDNERRFKIASEQVNIYFWEYIVETREMRPCFRCMRDLGLPAVLTNYPESAFERGVFPPEVHDLYRSWHRQVAAGVPELEAIIPLTMDRIPFRVRYTTEFDENGKPVKAYGSAALVKDAAARPAELETAEEDNSRALQLIAQHSDRVVLLYDLATQRIRFSDTLDDQYGMNNSTIASLFGEGRIMPESQENARRILRHIEEGIPYGRETIRFKYRENYYCWLDFKYTTLFDDEKRPTGAFLSYTDITAQVEAKRRSEEDGMTGLLNRATAEERISMRIRQAGHPGVLLLLDMDGLKVINDTFGHHEGDRAICAIAQVLKGHFRKSDIVGRFGGDEFIVYLTTAEGPDRTAAGLSLLLQKLEAVAIGDGRQGIHCSIGCAAHDGSLPFETLYHRADAALYHAKRTGKHRFAFFLEGAEWSR